LVLATASLDVPAAPDTPTAADVPPWETNPALEQNAPQPPPAPPKSPKEDNSFKGVQERPEVTKVILTGDRLRKYFPDASCPPVKSRKERIPRGRNAASGS